LNFSAAFTEGEGLVLMCDTRGIALASGSGCVTKSLQASHVLEAIGLDPALAQAAVLLSLGQGNTDAEVDYFLEVFPKAVERLRAMSPALSAPAAS
jgi:cysteine desulfurase